MNAPKALLAALLSATAPASLAAQDIEPAGEIAPAPVPQDAQAEGEVDEIVVTGQRERGAVLGDIPPEIQLHPADIRAYGAGSLEELLEALGPETGSARGRGGGGPVVLLNGRRISGFREIRGIPPEAILRVDILPEEVAPQYGYPADQRVVNFVLRERFRAVTAEIEHGFATAGGRGTGEAELNILRLNDNGRVSFDFEYERETPLLESERDIIQSDSAPPLLEDALAGDATPANLGDYRTLLGQSDEMELGATVNRTIFGDVSATLNGTLGATATESRFGLPSASLTVPASNPFATASTDQTFTGFVDASGPLTRVNDGRTAHLGLSMNGDLQPWRWSLTANYDHSNSVNRTDGGIDLSAAQALLDANDPDFNPFAPLDASLISVDPRDRSRSASQSADARLVLNGPLFDLPAGGVTASLRAGADMRDFEGETLRAGVETLRSFSRDEVNAQGSLEIPIASRRDDVLAAIGDLSANVNAEVEHLSDFGTLRTFGYGLNWAPIDDIRLIASVTDEDGAPSVQQLGDPNILTPNVRVFDFVRGETVDITRLDGGNAGLAADNRRVMKLGLTVKPLGGNELTMRADYTASRTLNPIASFPTATPEIEAAFPGRFVRDASGQLVSIDNRPVNFQRSDNDQLRWGFNFSKSLSQSRGEGGENPEARGGRRGGGGRGFGGRGGDARGGRLQLSVYHTWRIEDTILIRDGVPKLDLLDGSAVGGRGGQPRHEVQVRAGLFKDGYGARLSANWQDATFVRGAGGGGNDLFFDDFTTVDLRLFADLGQQRSLVRDHPFFASSRITLRIDNLFDSRLRVTDAAGVTPIGYQPALLDPLGRTVSIGFRKLFF